MRGASVPRNTRSVPDPPSSKAPLGLRSNPESWKAGWRRSPQDRASVWLFEVFNFIYKASATLSPSNSLNLLIRKRWRLKVNLQASGGDGTLGHNTPAPSASSSVPAADLKVTRADRVASGGSFDTTERKKKNRFYIRTVRFRLGFNKEHQSKRGRRRVVSQENSQAHNCRQTLEEKRKGGEKNEPRQSEGRELRQSNLQHTRMDCSFPFI